jgi:hypothetical protein
MLARAEVRMLKEVTMKEIEAIFAVTDRMGLSRELLVIPLAPRHPGRVRQTPAGKLEIMVDAEADFSDFIAGLEGEIRKVTGS